MKYENAIGTLVHSACPSIQYRVRKEILGESPVSPMMLELQNQILKDEAVQDIFSWQEEDGWLGGQFHGDHGPECGVRRLAEKGVTNDHPVMIKALRALKLKSNDFQDVSFCLGRVGKALDDHHMGGSAMVLACVFAYAGLENENLVQTQIQEALAGFQYVLTVRSVDELYKVRKDGTLVFNAGVKWPSIYHLRLLSFTQSWKGAQNKQMLADAVGKLAAFSPIPQIKVLEKGQVMAPASVFMGDFNPDMEGLTPQEWMVWFHRAEMVARLGIADAVLAIKGQIDFLAAHLDANDGFFQKPLSHFYFTKWSQYMGLALENDWKANGARRNDLTFRSLLILKYAGR